TILNPIIQFMDTSDPPLPATIDTWTWTFGDGTSDTLQNTEHTYTDTGVFQVTLTVVNQFSCSDNIAFSVEVEPEFTLHIPNTFTPNGDGINEFFPRAANDLIPGIGIGDDFVMYIYDRWGDLIFESSSILEPWDGTANKGKNLAQEDVYAWVIIAKDHNLAKHKFVGHVTLIR
ncbi:MAG: gliding motility-associated C-terminal domain-containing protein, partial [Flavobacteriales bacterium]|nr:gliding motility-associated C-terminal domain-containing protein [Flavobacteriales bacterium]